MQTELDIQPNIVIPILKDELASRDMYRKITTRGRETYEFPFDNIEVREGHNARKANNIGFSTESLQELARSIFHEGLQEPITIDVIKRGDQLIGIITKGERRWRSIGIIRAWIKEGKVSELFSGDPSKDIPTFDKIECFINTSRITQKDRDMMMLLENMARVDLTPLEQAEVVARLKEAGMTASQIAKSIPGMSTMQVSLRLTLAGISDAEKERVKDGKISPTAAVKLAKEELDPEVRLSRIDAAAEGENGKLKIEDVKPEEGETFINEETGEVFLTQEELNNSLRNVNLKSASQSEPIDIDDDKSMRGTSPRASTPTGDPAQKAKDDIDASDARIASGKATAFDLVTKLMDNVKFIDKETEGLQDNHPKLTTVIYDCDKILVDLRTILKK